MTQLLHRIPSSARIVLSVLVLWTAISVLGALQTYSDNLRAGLDSHYPALLATWFVEYAVPLIVLSCGMSLALARWPSLLDRPRNVVFLFAALVLLFQPLQWTYMAWQRDYLDLASLDDARKLLMKMLLVGWFSTTGTFAAVLAFFYSRRAKERELAWQRSQTDMLNLRLALEEQRMLALRAQLEPHFLFNALNAISALVRSGDKPLALNGVQLLSDLLRYVLSASARNTATLAEELRFVQDYLALQRLRYGERLQVHVDGADRLDRIACPPLLLQPLVENALRHDLECCEEASDIRLSFVREHGAMLVRVSNPARRGVKANPGAGLGLSNTQDRLRLMHAEAALRAGLQGERFVAEIRLPLPGPA
ncbi:histidine kinase [Massilia sp. G4R7]|uniref:Histidine kinase n=1 Tax=Massilia phyllostachyos TaxID=2898585 RepID=A0ABS8Q247_9BURK|nr:histidine kinase [Massilia phyllostachyos]MCD2515800.1 histidine kinase [Massilia phyllostachyos]